MLSLLQLWLQNGMQLCSVCFSVVIIVVIVVWRPLGSRESAAIVGPSHRVCSTGKLAQYAISTEGNSRTSTLVRANCSPALVWSWFLLTNYFFSLVTNLFTYLQLCHSYTIGLFAVLIQCAHFRVSQALSYLRLDLRLILFMIMMIYVCLFMQMIIFSI